MKISDPTKLTARQIGIAYLCAFAGWGIVALISGSQEYVIMKEAKVHESFLAYMLLPAIRQLGLDVQWTDIRVRHSGSDQSPEGRSRKHARDLRLLEFPMSGSRILRLSALAALLSLLTMMSVSISTHS